MNQLISPTYKSEIVTANKKLVDALLLMNTRNRKQKENNITRLSDDIENGCFFLTASGIGVSKTGVLLDGQNRLLAIRKSGYPPVKFCLVTGLEDESQRVVDRHSKRNLSDVLTMHMNITVSTHMVALANAVYAFGATRNKPFAGAHNGAMSDGRVSAFMAEYNELALEVVSASGASKASVAAALFVYALHQHDKAIEFCRDVAKGVNIAEDHPAYRLRAAIVRLKSAGNFSGRMELFKLSASACVLHSQGRTAKVLRVIDSWDSAPWKWCIDGDDIFDQGDSL